MKLIDSDKLKTHLWDSYCHYACAGRDLNKSAYLNVAICAVEVQEEIEAIPIQFLKDWSEQNEYDETIPRTIPLVLSAWEDWRKENDTN